MIMAIDSGNLESGYVIAEKETLKPIQFGKILNSDLREVIKNAKGIEYVAIENVASYGMAVGATVFETCVWVGRFTELSIEHLNIEPTYIYRKDEKMNLCGSMRAKDSNIIQALVDRFAKDTPNKGKGTKANKGWFYGFKKDVWSAYAVLVTYYDLYLREEFKYERNKS